MKNDNKAKTSYVVLIVLSILACILFYILFLFSTEILPLITKHRFTSEWIYVFVSSIPILLILGIYFSDKISEINFGKDGVGVKLGSKLSASLIEPIDLNDQIAQNFFYKGSKSDLDRLINSIGQSSSPPIFLLVQLEELRIDFRLMRQYVYKLSDVAPIQYIVFVGNERRYLGYMTLDKFKSKFPRFSIELLLEDLENNKVRRADLPPIFNQNMRQSTIDEYLDRLIYAQWRSIQENPIDDNYTYPNLVHPTDLDLLGSSDIKVFMASSPVDVYWLLMESNLNGMPVVNNEGIFIGIITRERVMQSVILQLLQKSKKTDPKE